MSGGREGLARVLRPLVRCGDRYCGTFDAGNQRCGECCDAVDAATTVVLDHLAAVASEAAVVEVVSDAVFAMGQGYGQPDFEPEDAATLSTAALAAFVGHLRGDGEVGR